MSNKLILGTWKLGDNPSHRENEIATLKYALSHGITHIDTAEMYGAGKSEHLVGEVIKDFDRHQLHITTKVHPSNANLKQLGNALRASLKRLNTSYIDLYLLHWNDGTIKIDEVITLFEHYKSLGLIKAWGVSNFDTEDMIRLYDLPFGQNCAANQVLYHMGARGIEFDLIPWMNVHRCQLMVYSTLGHNQQHRKHIINHPHIINIAAKHQVSPYQIMLAFVFRIKGIWAIAKASSTAHVKELIKARDIVLTLEDVQLIDSAFNPPTQKVALEEI